MFNRNKERFQFIDLFGSNKVLVREKFWVSKKKLRDVQQEREGTRLNYFKVFSNYIEQFSWSISVYLSPSWFISVYF